MSRRRIVLWAVLLIALAGSIGYRLSAMRQPPAPPPVKVAFVTGGSSAFWQLAVNGAQAAAKRNNVALNVEIPAEDENLEQQTTILEKLNLADVRGVAISPLDAAGQTPQINKIAERAIVVTFDSDAQESRRVSHIGTGNISAGQACAKLLNEALPKGGKIAVLAANDTKENNIDRKAGFEERLAAFTEGPAGGNNSKPKFVVVDYLIDNGNDDACEANIRKELEKHPDLAGFVGMNANHGAVLVKALTKLGKVDQVKLVTFDASDETLMGVEAGHIYATLAQDPYQFGYDAVETLATLARGDETRIPVVGRGSLYIAAEPIKKENVSEFRERMTKRGAVAAKK
jgi:ribose transport system substrate-binding protein